MRFSVPVENLIADFRGLPRAYSESTPRAERPLEGLLENLRTHYRLDQPRIEETIMRRWKEVVGPERASRCSPERLIENTKLVIFVPNPTLRTELKFDQKRILERLRALPGCEQIRELILRQG